MPAWFIDIDTAEGDGVASKSTFTPEEMLAVVLAEARRYDEIRELKITTGDGHVISAWTDAY